MHHILSETGWIADNKGKTGIGMMVGGRGKNNQE
jgi:hypothetical protein